MTQKAHSDCHQLALSRPDFSLFIEQSSTGCYAAKVREDTHYKQGLRRQLTPAIVRPQLSESQILHTLLEPQQRALSDCLLVGREGLIIGRTIEPIHTTYEYENNLERHLRLRIKAGKRYLQDLNSTFVACTRGKQLLPKESIRIRLGQ